MPQQLTFRVNSYSGTVCVGGSVSKRGVSYMFSLVLSASSAGPTGWASWRGCCAWCLLSAEHCSRAPRVFHANAFNRFWTIHILKWYSYLRYFQFFKTHYVFCYSPKTRKCCQFAQNVNTIIYNDYHYSLLFSILSSSLTITIQHLEVQPKTQFL